MTSRRSPISLTSWVMSSSIQGDSSALTRVHSAVEPRSISRPTRISPSRAASLRSIGIASSRLPSRMSVFVAMSAALATIFSLEKSRKWIIREGRSGISASGAGAPMASGLRKSRGLRMVGTILTRQSICGGDIPSGMRRVMLAALVVSLAAPAAAQAHQIRVTAPAQFDVSSPRCATPCLTGRGPRCASRSPGPTGLDYVAVALPRHQPRHARRRARGGGQPPPARLAGAGSGPGPAQARGRRAPCARPTVTPGDERPRPAARRRTARPCAPRAAEGRRPARRPAGRRAAAGLRRALDHRPGAGRRLRAARRSRLPRGRRAARRCLRRRPGRPPCPPCPPLPPGSPAAIVCPTAAPAVCPEPA